MSDLTGSITKLVAQVADGDNSAVFELFQRVRHRLVEFVSNLVGDELAASAELEEVAARSFDKIVIWIRNHGFPSAAGRDHLFAMFELSALSTANRFSAQNLREFREREPEPTSLVGADETRVEFVERWDKLLSFELMDDRNKSISILIMHGFTYSEIAEFFDVPVRSIERRVHKLESLFHSTTSLKQR